MSIIDEYEADLAFARNAALVVKRDLDQLQLSTRIILAAIVKNAGGELRIPRHLLVSLRGTLERLEDMEQDQIIFRYKE